MMTDKRSYDGWRRLGRSVMAEVGHDDPAGLAQVRAHLDELEELWLTAMATLAGEEPVEPGWGGRSYSHGEIARELGVTRQAVTKRLAKRAKA